LRMRRWKGRILTSQRVDRGEVRDEAHPRRHSVGQVRTRLDAGEPRQPDLVQGDARQVRRPPDRRGRREAARHDAVDQGARAGGQGEELDPSSLS